MKLRVSLGVLILVLAASSPVISQHELTYTTTAANTNGIMSSIDLPGLTGNPLAIIIATPLGNTKLLNTHPLQAWYYSGKWFLSNSDSERMPVGCKYQVQFYQEPSRRATTPNTTLTYMWTPRSARSPRPQRSMPGTRSHSLRSQILAAAVKTS